MVGVAVVVEGAGDTLPVADGGSNKRVQSLNIQTKGGKGV